MTDCGSRRNRARRPTSARASTAPSLDSIDAATEGVHRALFGDMKSKADLRQMRAAACKHRDVARGLKKRRRGGR
jgi:hypothetical protein